MAGKDSNKNYAVALFEATSGAKGAELNTIIKNFFRLLIKNQKFQAASDIIKEFEAYAKKQAGIVNIAVTSSRALDEKTLQHIKTTFGSMVEVTETVDRSILGGIIVQTENTIFDASLKMQLKRLRASLV